MQPYGLIPDLHADLDRLEWSIHDMQDSNIIFLGDLIDADPTNKTPSDEAVLTRVKRLIEQNGAKCILGNHELNAILFHRRFKGSSRPLRDHSEKNVQQHLSFLKAFGTETKEALSWTEWLLDRLPLWIETRGFRVAHACWSQNSIEIIKERREDGFLKLEDLEEIALKETEFARAVETIVSGPEVMLPDDCFFLDYYNEKRSKVRLKWWGSTNANWQNSALSVPKPELLPKSKLPEDVVKELYPADAVPVFVGHYKMSGVPKIQCHNASSLDFPQNPCVYTWCGEPRLIDEHLLLRYPTE